MKKFAALLLLLAGPALATPVFTFKVSGTNDAVDNTTTSVTFSTSGPSLLIVLVGFNDNAASHTLTSVKLGATGTENNATFRVRRLNVADPNSTEGVEIWTFWSSASVTNWIAEATGPGGTAPFAVIK